MRVKKARMGERKSGAIGEKEVVMARRSRRREEARRSREKVATARSERTCGRRTGEAATATCHAAAQPQPRGTKEGRPIDVAATCGNAPYFDNCSLNAKEIMTTRRENSLKKVKGPGQAINSGYITMVKIMLQKSLIRTLFSLEKSASK